MRNLALILSVLLNAGLLAFILLNGNGEKAPEGPGSSESRHTSEPTADESLAERGESREKVDVADAGNGEPSDEATDPDEAEPAVTNTDPVAESEDTVRREWHDQASRDIRQLVHDRLGDDAYLMEFGCEGSDCQGQVYFAGEDDIARVESLLDTINESDGALGVEAGRPALLRSFRPDPNGITANIVVQEGAELPEPTPEQVMEAARRFMEANGCLPESRDRTG